MKKTVLFVFICLVFTFAFLTGCSNNSDPALTRLDIGNAPSGVGEFVQAHTEQNGIYLYTGSQDCYYLFLNGVQVKQGEKASFFSDVHTQINQDTLSFHFKEQYTENYEKKLDNRLLYRIDTGKAFEYIKVFKNEKETSFTAIGN